MHISVLRKHLARGDLEDQTVADAVTMRLAAAIEALANCSDELRIRAFGGDWPLPYRQSRWVVVDGGSPVAACTRWCVAKPCATAFTVAEGDVVSV